MRQLVVVSPHLDDAALSLGAAIASASEAGIPVTVLTVFAGDPNSDEPAGEWDALCGFSRVGEAARARRAEDARASEILGARSVWLPFAYGDSADTAVRDEDAIWEAIWPHVQNAALVLIPGHPLVHPDHAWLTRLVARRASNPLELGLYVEQPYANLAVIGRGYTHRPVLVAAALALRTPLARRLQRPTPNTVSELFDAPFDWYSARADRRHRRAKASSVQAYESQVRMLGRRLLPRIRLYEWGWTGEGIGLPAHGSKPARRRYRVPKWNARTLDNRPV